MTHSSKLSIETDVLNRYLLWILKESGGTCYIWTTIAHWKNSIKYLSS